MDKKLKYLNAKIEDLNNKFSETFKMSGIMRDVRRTVIVNMIQEIRDEIDRLKMYEDMED